MAIDWTKVAADVNSAAGLLAPLIEAAVPESAIAIEVIKGMAAAEPAAVALFNQIKGGTPVTPEQMEADFSAYHVDDDQLNADIEAAKKLAQ